MGLLHSGAVVDAVWVGLVEKNFAAHKGDLTKFKIPAWWRFKDDVFAVATDLPLWRQFFRIRVYLCACCHDTYLLLEICVLVVFVA